MELTYVQEVALIGLYEYTNRTFDLDTMGGDGHVMNRRVIIALLTEGRTSDASGCSLVCLKCAVNQSFNMGEMSDLARIDFMHRNFCAICCPAED